MPKADPAALMSKREARERLLGNLIRSADPDRRENAKLCGFLDKDSRPRKGMADALFLLRDFLREDIILGYNYAHFAYFPTSSLAFSGGVAVCFCDKALFPALVPILRLAFQCSTPKGTNWNGVCGSREPYGVWAHFHPVTTNPGKFLAVDTRRAAIPARGGILVNVPAPERFALSFSRFAYAKPDDARMMEDLLARYRRSADWDKVRRDLDGCWKYLKGLRAGARKYAGKSGAFLRELLN